MLGRLTRRERLALFVVLLVALGVRLLHLHTLEGDVLFEHPALDEERYVQEARKLAFGQGFEPRAFWQPPGIMYALAAVMKLTGGALFWPHLAQAVVGTITCGLTFALGRRLFDARVGLLASLVVALHGGMIFSSGELLPATWAGAFDLLALLLLVDARDSRRHAIGAGLALGVSAVFTPIVLPFAGLAAVLLLRAKAPRETVLAFVGAVALPILPVTLRNWSQGGELVLVSTNGGLNFFIGNNARSFETWSTRPGVHWVELTEMPLRLAGIQKPGAQSAWFTRQALGFIASHPLDAAALYLRKLWLFFHAAEIPRDGDLYLARRDSWVLRALTSPGPLWLPGSLLVPLGLAGAFRVGRDRDPQARWLLVFLVAQALSIAAFFVSGRYRVPVTPVLALFAAFVVFELRRAPLLGAATLALALLSIVPLREATTSFAAEPDFFRALTYRRLGRHGEAMLAFGRATAADPRDPRPWFELGLGLDAARRPEAAAAAWTKAAECDPTDLRPRRMAAAALLRAGDRAGAIAQYEAAIKANPTRTAFEHVQLAAIHAEAGQGEDLLRALGRALELDPRWAQAAGKELLERHRDKLGAELVARVEALLAQPLRR